MRSIKLLSDNVLKSIALRLIAVALAFIIILQVSSCSKDYKSEAMDAINMIWAASKVYYHQNGEWPTSLKQLTELQLEIDTPEGWFFHIESSSEGIKEIRATAVRSSDSPYKLIRFTPKTGKWRFD